MGGISDGGWVRLTGVWGEGGHRYKGEPSALAYRLRRTHTWVRAGILCVCVCVCVCDMVWCHTTHTARGGVVKRINCDQLVLGAAEHAEVVSLETLPLRTRGDEDGCWCIVWCSRAPTHFS